MSLSFLTDPRVCVAGMRAVGAAPGKNAETLFRTLRPKLCGCRKELALNHREFNRLCLCCRVSERSVVLCLASPAVMIIATRSLTMIIITAFERSSDGGKGLAPDAGIRWALEEVGQPYEVRLISFKAMKEPAHLALHPLWANSDLRRRRLRFSFSRWGLLLNLIRQEFSGWCRVFRAG